VTSEPRPSTEIVSNPPTDGQRALADWRAEERVRDAAPLMLAALRDLLLVTDAHGDGQDEPGCLICAAIATARAAVAAATEARP
jgi:hypothetical protein